MAANKFSLFGFTIARQQQDAEQAVQQSFTPPVNDDGALTITSAAYYGTYVDLDGTAKNEIELIGRYREMAMQPEIESAIDDIVNEAIVQDDDGRITDIVLDDFMTTVDVKTKETACAPKPHYSCSVADYNTKQKCDYYAFVRVKKDLSVGWYLGVYPKKYYVKDAIFLKAGDFDPDNNFTVKSDCYNIPISKLSCGMKA
jgi:hypothetical protein